MVWAIQKIKNNPGLKGEKAVVIEVKLEALESAFLNLDSRQGLNRLESFLERLESQGIQVNKSSFDEPSKLRCFLLSLLPDTIWLVQKNFKIKSRFDDSSLFTAMDISLSGTQVSVRNHCAINISSIKCVSSTLLSLKL